MTDNKLTDIKEYHIEEIIRTLESNSTPFSKVIVDLINRLKTDYDNALEKNAGLALCLLHGVFNDDEELKNEVFKVAKIEAYKEFAEKLHEELRIYGIKDKFNKSLFLNVVDKAKKELVGDE